MKTSRTVRGRVLCCWHRLSNALSHGGRSRGRRTTDPDFNMIPTTLDNNHMYSAYHNQNEKSNQSALLCYHLNLKANITTTLLMKYVAHGIPQDPGSAIELRCCTRLVSNARWWRLSIKDVFRSWFSVPRSPFQRNWWVPYNHGIPVIEQADMIFSGFGQLTKQGVAHDCDDWFFTIYLKFVLRVVSDAL